MKQVLALSIVFFSLISVAATPSEEGTITQLLVHRNPIGDANVYRRYVVKLSGTINANPCDSNYDTWTGYFSDEAGKAQYSTLLAASLSETPIKIEGTESYCEHSSALIRNVYIKF